MDEQNANSLLNIQINLQEYPGGMVRHPFKNLKPVIVLIQHVEFTVLFNSNRFSVLNFLMNAKVWVAVAPVCTNWKMKVSFDERNEPAPSTSVHLVKPIHSHYKYLAQQIQPISSCTWMKYFFKQ